MNIFKRIALVIRSTINSLIGSTENPAKIMDTVIADLSDNLNKVKIQVATAMKDEKALERKVAENKKLVADYEGKAMAALQSGEEKLAIEALKRKQSSASLAFSLENELIEQRKVTTVLKDGVKNLEERIAETKTKRNTLVAQQNRAETRNELTASVGTISKQAELFETFDRMADKIAAIEDMSVAVEELDTFTNERRLNDAKLRAIEYDSVIADDLARLKKRVNISKLPPEDAQIVDISPENAQTEIANR